MGAETTIDSLDDLLDAVLAMPEPAPTARQAEIIAELDTLVPTPAVPPRAGPKRSKVGKSSYRAEKSCRLRDARFSPLRIEADQAPKRATTSVTTSKGEETTKTETTETAPSKPKRPYGKERIDDLVENAEIARPTVYHRTPARWRDLSDLGLMEWWHVALKRNGSRLAFSLNLTPKFTSYVRSKSDYCATIQERVRRGFVKELGRCPMMFFAVEETDDHHRRLHLHGEIEATESDAEAIRETLRKAVGQWKTTRQHQAHTKADPDEGWVFYCAKDRMKHDASSRYPTGRGASFSSIKGRRWYGASRELNALAKSLQSAWREDFIEQMKAAHKTKAKVNTDCLLSHDVDADSTACENLAASNFDAGLPMQHYILTQEEFGEFWPDMREVTQHDLGIGFVNVARHPLLGSIATVHDGDHIGVLFGSPCVQGCTLGRPSNPIQHGAAYARLAAIGSLMALD